MGCPTHANYPASLSTFLNCTRRKEPGDSYGPLLRERSNVNFPDSGSVGTRTKQQHRKFVREGTAAGLYSPHPKSVKSLKTHRQATTRKKSGNFFPEILS